MRRSKAAQQRFGDWLDITLSNRGILGKTVAEHLGVHDSTVSRIRSGAQAADMPTVVGLAKLLGLDDQRLAVTAGLAPPTWAKPYPMPEPTAQRDSVRRQIERIRGLSDTDRRRLISVYDELHTVAKGTDNA